MQITNKHGFTLVEALIVIGIVVILSAAATPSFMGRIEQQGIRTAAMDLHNTMQQARGIAVRENIDCTISFNVANNTYTVDCLNDLTVPLERYRGRAGFGGPGGDEVTDGLITFNSRGLCTNTGTVYITNSNQSAHYRLIVPLTGYAAMHKRSGGAWI